MIKSGDYVLVKPLSYWINKKDYMIYNNNYKCYIKKMMNKIYKVDAPNGFYNINHIPFDYEDLIPANNLKFNKLKELL
jgi:translation initiation factor IF-1